MKKQQAGKGHFAVEDTTIKVHVSGLQVGMYVSSLDRPWLETPFLMQGFLIEHQDDIASIGEYCEYVHIDTVRQQWVMPEEHVVTPHNGKSSEAHKVSVQDEHKRAMGVYKEARRVTKSLMDDIRLGGSIDTDLARETVNSCVQSVIRNPNALLWMSKLRDKTAYTAEHCLNVCILAVAFGRRMDLDEKELENLGFCGLMHDIGKLKISEDILQKPSKLSPQEFKLMKAHPIFGANLLMKSSEVYRGAIDVAYTHHEKLNGMGYPKGLKGNSISKYSRMISIVDAYDAMTSERNYADAVTSTNALREIYRCRGSHFDDNLALHFIKTVGLYPPGCIVELARGSVGMVLAASPKHRHLPEVYMLLDEDKQPAEGIIINLEGINTGALGKDYLIKKVHRDGTFGIHFADYREHGLNFRNCSFATP